MTSAVQISLSSDEAIVLFDLLHRWENAKRIGPTEHHGEQVALWNLSALLETVLEEPLSPDYERLVNEARTRLVVT